MKYIAQGHIYMIYKYKTKSVYQAIFQGLPTS